ncbi:MAG: hypothetical protein U1D97_12365 [Desulfuromonadales bacterium]|nr:hypothetical protein [Desulfuromonadales bacterium]
MAMTKEDWQRVEKALSGHIGYVTLLVEGREIRFQRGLVKKNTLGIGMFVDGKMEREWSGSKNDHPEQRFYYPKEFFFWTAKSRAAIKKMTPARLKREGLSSGAENKKDITFTPMWPNASAIKRHFSKNFPDAELIAATGDRA